MTFISVSTIVGGITPLAVKVPTHGFQASQSGFPEGPGLGPDSNGWLGG